MRRQFFFGVVLLAATAVLQAQTAIDIQVNAGVGRHPIDPRVYGTAYADAPSLADLRIPVHRAGGNASTRYNWEVNASNRSADWYFESIADGPAVAGEWADTIIDRTKAASGDTIVTIPTIGWVAKVASNRERLVSFSIGKYGPQTGVDPYWSDAGNGIATSTGKEITNNDPNDASVPSTPAFQQRWVEHLVSRYGRAGAGGVRYYAMDNEPGLWHTTHRDVHPNGASMDEVLNSTVAYAGMVKNVDTNAQVLGPEEWGWSGYLYSGADLQWGARNGWSNLPDRAAHGNQDFVAWYLSQLRQRETSGGRRLLDIFTLHYYPQGGEFGNDTSTAMQQRRNRSTRSLWDPSYVDESWIATNVNLIPRMKSWVANNYPNTKIGITEYNWGAEAHINGATTQADILGILGREGVDMATMWGTPAASSPTYKAFKLYRNYDGQGRAFGETSVSTTVPNPDSVSAFSAQRTSDGALTIMVINKDLSNSPTVNVRLSNFAAAATAQAWRLTSSNAINRLADVSVSSGNISTTLPAQSITLFVVAGGGQTQPQAPGAPTNVKILNSPTSSPASVSASTGTPQSTQVNTAFPTPLRATVRDASSSPVTGVTVTFTAPSTTGSARFNGSLTATAVTDASGVATAPTLTANGSTGSYTVTASVSGVSGVASFQLTNTGSSSTGGSGTWVNITPPGMNVSSAYGANSVVADPLNRGTFYAHSSEGVWKTTNYGTSWTGPIDGGKISGELAAGPGVLYSGGINGSSIGFWRSTDGGVTWTNHRIAPAPSNRQDVYPPSVNPYDGNHLLMPGHEQDLLVQSTDGGLNWTNLPLPAGMRQGAGTAFIFFINTGDAASTRRTWLWTAQGTGGQYGTWRTTDGGANWTKVDNNEHPHGNMQIFQPDTSGVVFMGGIYSAKGWGVLRSTDYGQTWTHVGANQASGTVFGTPNRIFSFYGCGSGCSGYQYANMPAITGWVDPGSNPPGMVSGANMAATVFNGTTWVILTSNWQGGLWRYIE